MRKGTKQRISLQATTQEWDALLAAKSDWEAQGAGATSMQMYLRVSATGYPRALAQMGEAMRVAQLHSQQTDKAVAAARELEKTAEALETENQALKLRLAELAGAMRSYALGTSRLLVLATCYRRADYAVLPTDEQAAQLRQTVQDLEEAMELEKAAKSDVAAIVHGLSIAANDISGSEAERRAFEDPH